MVFKPGSERNVRSTRNGEVGKGSTSTRTNFFAKSSHMATRSRGEKLSEEKCKGAGYADSELMIRFTMIARGLHHNQN